jgi:hypothetical protein
MPQLKFAAQKVHDDLIKPTIVEKVGSAQPANDLETEALVNAPGRVVVLVYFNLDAVKISKEKSVFANQSRGFRAEAFPTRRGLPNTNEHGGNLCAGDVEKTAKPNQATAAQFDHRKLGTVGPKPRVPIVGLLAHFEGYVLRQGCRCLQ